jgi:hypothetical protein
MRPGIITPSSTTSGAAPRAAPAPGAVPGGIHRSPQLEQVVGRGCSRIVHDEDAAPRRPGGGHQASRRQQREVKQALPPGRRAQADAAVGLDQSLADARPVEPPGAPRHRPA